MEVRKRELGEAARDGWKRRKCYLTLEEDTSGLIVL